MHIMQLTNDGQAVSLPISPESWPGLWEKLSLQRDPFWLDLTGAADTAFVESRLLEQLTVYKRIILRIRRVLTSQREVVNKLARDIHAVIDAEDRVYFRDVYDHLVRLHELSDNTRELVTSSMEIYLSLINNRMNDIMKTLTVITTLFMPLTFLTGFFGMNFFQAVLPSSFWTGAPMLIFILLIMLLLPTFMYGWIL